MTRQQLERELERLLERNEKLMKRCQIRKRNLTKAEAKRFDDNADQFDKIVKRLKRFKSRIPKEFICPQ